jgi:ATP-binding cassette subfamily B protein
MFGAAQAIAIAGANDQVVNHLSQINQDRRQAALRDALFSRVLDSVFANVVSLGTAAILLLAGRSMRAGTFTVGDFSLFIYFLGYVTTITGSLGGIMARYRQADVSFDRLLQLIQGNPAETLVAHRAGFLVDEPVPVPYIEKTDDDKLVELQVSGLSFRYPDSSSSVNDINLTLKRSSFTVITGRVGSGKTTLLRTLLGQLPKDSGTIRWNGTEVVDAAEFFTPPRSAYTPQVPRLFSDTLKDNILMGIPEDKSCLKDALEASVMDRDITNFEDGLDTLIGTKGMRLSGGQIQRARLHVCWFVSPSCWYAMIFRVRLM